MLWLIYVLMLNAVDRWRERRLKYENCSTFKIAMSSFSWLIDWIMHWSWMLWPVTRKCVSKDIKKNFSIFKIATSSISDILNSIGMCRLIYALMLNSVDRWLCKSDLKNSNYLPMKNSKLYRVPTLFYPLHNFICIYVSSIISWCCKSR